MLFEHGTHITTHKGRFTDKMGLSPMCHVTSTDLQFPYRVESELIRRIVLHFQ